MESVLVFVYFCFSINIFFSWECFYFYCYIVYNGEINIMWGNVNWMQVCQVLFELFLFGEDMVKVQLVINIDGSDFIIFDNVLELFYLVGCFLFYVVMMMIFEFWSVYEFMSQEKKVFYKYYFCLMEFWDGLVFIVFINGKMMGVVLDCNGLCFFCYYVIKDDLVIMVFEVGVLFIELEWVVKKGCL